MMVLVLEGEDVRAKANAKVVNLEVSSRFGQKVMFLFPLEV